MKVSSNFLLGFLYIGMLFLSGPVRAQSLYTAEGYHQETIKEPYRLIKEKTGKGTALSNEEELYVKDYEVYLSNYYAHLSEDEKAIYERMKFQWAESVRRAQPPVENTEFEWRNRDRLLNTAFGAYYGAALLFISDARGAAAQGIPLITGGLWLLGPAINPKKYEGITQRTIRASNTGKTLGLGYGAALGLAIAGDAENANDVVLALSTIGSISLGEFAFQTQKKRNISDGQIEMMRHYGFLGPGVGLSIAGVSETENMHAIGFSLLSGGVAGLLIGKKVASQYEYSRGDVNAVNSLGLISAGLGMTLVANELEDSDGSPGLYLIPAAGGVMGTLLAQRMVKNVHLTRKQGSTINLSASGAALIGFGITAIAETDSPMAYFGVASVLALGTHQVMFNKYRQQNLADNFRGSSHRKSKKYALSMRVQPENYVVNKNMRQPRVFNPANPLNQPIVNLTLKFR